MMAFGNPVVFSQTMNSLSFLSLATSPEANGMGGIAASTSTDNAMAVAANPGQLGLMSLSNYFVGSTNEPKTQLLPELQLDGLTYYNTVVNVGINLQRVFPISFPLSVGGGYSRILLNLGKFFVADMSPTPTYIFDGSEESETYTIGIGCDYLVKVGVGYSSRHLKSTIAVFDIQRSGLENSASASMSDIGIISQIPVLDIVSKLRKEPIGDFLGMTPSVDLTLGYVLSNYGSESATYFDNDFNEPFPRKATFGFSWKAGLLCHAAEHEWELTSFTFGREVEDILFNRIPAIIDPITNVMVTRPSFDYLSGFGHIEFLKNVILGERTGNVTIRKGWQLSLGELVYLRGGSTNEADQELSSKGLGVRLAGLLKLLETLTPRAMSASHLDFILDHFDIRFDHSSVSSSRFPTHDASYDGLNVILR